MSAHTENETWIIQTGDYVIQKRAQSGVASLSDWERLVYCLWVADYMIRNAGDFANAEVMYPDFQLDARIFAERLGLGETLEAFSLSENELQGSYYDIFEKICEEIKGSGSKAA